MKNWSKVFKFKEYDILIQRLCNNDDGEHISITLRVNEGQLITTMSFEDDVDQADKAFADYTKKDAQKVIDAFEKMYRNEEKNDDKKS